MDGKGISSKSPAPLDCATSNSQAAKGHPQDQTKYTPQRPLSPHQDAKGIPQYCVSIPLEPIPEPKDFMPKECPQWFNQYRDIYNSLFAFHDYLKEKSHQSDFLNGEGPVYNSIIISLQRIDEIMKSNEFSVEQQAHIELWLDSCLKKCPIEWWKLPRDINHLNKAWTPSPVEQSYVSADIEGFQTQQEQAEFIPEWSRQVVLGISIDVATCQYWNLRNDNSRPGKYFMAEERLKNEFSSIYNWLVLIKNPQVARDEGLTDVQIEAIEKRLDFVDKTVNKLLKSKAHKKYVYSWRDFSETPGLYQEVKELIEELSSASSIASPMNVSVSKPVQNETQKSLEIKLKRLSKKRSATTSSEPSQRSIRSEDLQEHSLSQQVLTPLQKVNKQKKGAVKDSLSEKVETSTPETLIGDETSPLERKILSPTPNGYKYSGSDPHVHYRHLNGLGGERKGMEISFDTMLESELPEANPDEYKPDPISNAPRAVRLVETPEMFSVPTSIITLLGKPYDATVEFIEYPPATVVKIIEEASRALTLNPQLMNQNILGDMKRLIDNLREHIHKQQSALGDVFYPQLKQIKTQNSELEFEDIIPKKWRIQMEHHAAADDELSRTQYILQLQFNKQQEAGEQWQKPDILHNSLLIHTHSCFDQEKSIKHEHILVSSELLNSLPIGSEESNSSVDSEEYTQMTRTELGSKVFNQLDRVCHAYFDSMSVWDSNTAEEDIGYVLALMDVLLSEFRDNPSSDSETFEDYQALRVLRSRLFDFQYALKKADHIKTKAALKTIIDDKKDFIERIAPNRKRKNRRSK